MRKQFKKALSMVLSAAMVLTLGSGLEVKSAKAADAKTFTVSLNTTNGTWVDGVGGKKALELKNGTQSVTLKATMETTDGNEWGKGLINAYAEIPTAGAIGATSITVSNIVVKINGTAYTDSESTGFAVNGEGKNQFMIYNGWDHKTGDDPGKVLENEYVKTVEISYDLTIAGLPEASQEPGTPGENPPAGSTSGAGNTTSGPGNTTSGGGSIVSGGASQAPTPTDGPTQAPSKGFTVEMGEWSDIAAVGEAVKVAEPGETPVEYTVKGVSKDDGGGTDVSKKVLCTC